MKLIHILCLSALIALWVSCTEEVHPEEGPTEAESPLTPMSLEDLSGFQATSENWQITGSVSSDPYIQHNLEASPETGILTNLPTEGGKNIFTTFEHGDIDLEIDFLMPKGSNSGIYLMGRYEIQLFDSWGVENPGFIDCGGIYERWDESRPEGQKGYDGVPPASNASRAPGLWQNLKISFKAPRWGKSGQKIEDAKFVEVIHNGVKIHENVSISGPTRAAAFEDEQLKGPLMIQGDHGPVAFKNIRYRLIDNKIPRMSAISYRYYEFDESLSAMPDFSQLTPTQEGQEETFDLKAHGTRESDYGFVFSANLEIEMADEYIFYLASDDGSIFYIDGKEVINHDGNHGMSEKSNHVQLSAGIHQIELRYYQGGGGFGLRMFVENSQLPKTGFYTPAYMFDEGSGAGEIIQISPKDRPLLHRGFMMYNGEKRTKTIGVGDPSGIHYIYDLEQGSPIKVWRGDFLDAGPMWISRGETQLAVPLGPGVEIDGDPSLTMMISPSDAWPDSMPDRSHFSPRGFELDPDGYPTFIYSAYEVLVQDKIYPDKENSTIKRELTFTSGQKQSKLWCKLASGKKIIKINESTFAIDQKYYLNLEGKTLKNMQIREIGGISEVVVPVLKGEKETKIVYSILW